MGEALFVSQISHLYAECKAWYYLGSLLSPRAIRRIVLLLYSILSKLFHSMFTLFYVVWVISFITPWHLNIIIYIYNFFNIFFSGIWLDSSYSFPWPYILQCKFQKLLIYIPYSVSLMSSKEQIYTRYRLLYLTCLIYSNFVGNWKLHCHQWICFHRFLVGINSSLIVCLRYSPMPITLMTVFW